MSRVHHFLAAANIAMQERQLESIEIFVGRCSGISLRRLRNRLIGKAGIVAPIVAREHLAPGFQLGEFLMIREGDDSGGEDDFSNGGFH